MRIVLAVIAVVLLAVALAAVLIRQLDHDAGVWHVDPLTAPKPSTPNSYRVGPTGTAGADATSTVYAMPAADLATAFDRIARAAGSDVVAGSSADGFVTYVETSALFAFPDYISVRFIEVDANSSTLAVFSRSRLGKSDLGVNKKRVEGWLGQLGG